MRITALFVVAVCLAVAFWPASGRKKDRREALRATLADLSREADKLLARDGGVRGEEWRQTVEKMKPLWAEWRHLETGTR
jgi:hypothetical protein